MNKSFPKGRVVLVIFLAAFLAAGVALVNLARTPQFYFEISMRSSVSGIAQTFYDVGRGVNETDSVRFPVDSNDGPGICRFPLSEDEYRALRFDPLDRGNAEITISTARIVNQFGHTIRNFSLEELKVADGVFHSEIKDRKLSLTLGPADNDPKLIINPGSP